MFRFTIRELVLVTTVVAMGVAWWIDRRAQASDASNRTKKASGRNSPTGIGNCQPEQPDRPNPVNERVVEIAAAE